MYLNIKSRTFRFVSSWLYYAHVLHVAKGDWILSISFERYKKHIVLRGMPRQSVF